MNDATGADTLAFIEALAGEYAETASARHQRPGASHDPLDETPAWPVGFFAPVIF